MLNSTRQHQRSFINGIHQAPLMNVLKAQHTMRRLSYGAHRVYSPSPAVTREESTFNLEVAIRGGLLRVNTTDKRDKKKKERKKWSDRATKLAGGVKGHPHHVVSSANCSACSGHITVADLLSHTLSGRSQLIYAHFLPHQIIISQTFEFKLQSIFTPKFELYIVALIKLCNQVHKNRELFAFYCAMQGSC